MIRSVERRRRRFWKPKSVYEHPDWPKKIAQVKVAVPSYDHLPAAVRAAMRAAHHDFSGVQMLDLWNKTESLGDEAKRIAYLVAAIEHNDQMLDARDRTQDEKDRLAEIAKASGRHRATPP